MTAHGDPRSSIFVGDSLLCQLVDRGRGAREEEAQLGEACTRKPRFCYRMPGAHHTDIPVAESVDAYAILAGCADSPNLELDLNGTHRTHHSFRKEGNDIHANEGRDAR